VAGGGPGDFWVNLELSATFLNRHPPMLDEGVRFATAVTALRPDSAAAHYNLGVALTRKGQPAEAVRHLRKAVELQPADARAHNNLGVALKEAGEAGEAVRHYRKALELRPDLVEALTNLGAALMVQGEVAEAVRYHRKALALQPDNVEAHVNLGNALGEQGPSAVEEASRHFRRALALRADLAEAHLGFGRCMVQKGRLDEALRHLRRAVELRPTFAAAHYEAGNALGLKGLFEEAIWHSRKALEVEPGHARARAGLGAALAARGELDEAIPHLRQAVELRPTDIQGRYSLGRALALAGRFGEALAAFRDGLAALRGEDPRRGQFDRMIRTVERLLELDRKLAAVVSGQAKPASEAERLDLAWLAQQPSRGLYVSSARLWRDAFASRGAAADDLRSGHRYNAARAAALAAAGQGPEAARLTGERRADWRRQALAWLRADLALLAKQAEAPGAGGRAAVRRALRRWQGDPDLAGLRDPAALAALPAEQPEECRQLWAEVAALLGRAAGEGR
jgi:tetratricopeptide (TPR) repeat protein